MAMGERSLYRRPVQIIICGVMLFLIAGVIASFFVSFDSLGLHVIVVVALVGILVGAMLFVVRAEREIRARGER